MTEAHSKLGDPLPLNQIAPSRRSVVRGAALAAAASALGCQSGSSDPELAGDRRLHAQAQPQDHALGPFTSPSTPSETQP